MGALEDVIEIVWPVLRSVRGDDSAEDGSWARQRVAARVPRMTIQCFRMSNRRQAGHEPVSSPSGFELVTEHPLVQAQNLSMGCSLTEVR